MTQIDFYMSAGDTEGARHNFVCRLLEKAVAKNSKVYVHTQDAVQAQHLDKSLWTFKPGSFIAHEIAGQDVDKSCPVIIGHDQEPDASRDILLNLANEVPRFFSRFERVLDVINHDQEIRSLGRKRYSFYKDRGYPLNYHDLKPN